MAKAWQVPTGDDLWQVVSRPVVERADEDAEGGTVGSNDLNNTLDTRANKAVEHVVAEVRGAIEAVGRHPVSITPGAVPPEGFQHVLALAAWRLAMPLPKLLSVILNEGGVFAPINQLVKDAREWLKGLQEGRSITLPLDPTGADYTTAVSATNPAVCGVMWGDNLADNDEYEAGVTAGGKLVNAQTQNMLTDELALSLSTTLPSGVTINHIPTIGQSPNGLITASPGAIATDSGGAVWIKTSGVLTNTGWEQRL